MARMGLLGGLLGGGGRLGLGQAAEDLLERGRRKLEEKGADLIVVNDVGRADIGFDAEDNEVWILRRDGAVEEVSRRSKREVADRIWDAWLAARAAAAVPAGPSRAAPPR